MMANSPSRIVLVVFLVDVVCFFCEKTAADANIMRCQRAICIRKSSYQTGEKRACLQGTCIVYIRNTCLYTHIHVYIYIHTYDGDGVGASGDDEDGDADATAAAYCCCGCRW